MKMSKKTLKFDKVEVCKKEFHASKQQITLNLVNGNQILTFDKLSVTRMIVLLGRYVLYFLK